MSAPELLPPRLEERDLDLPRGGRLVGRWLLLPRLLLLLLLLLLPRLMLGLLLGLLLRLLLLFLLPVALSTSVVVLELIKGELLQHRATLVELLTVAFPAQAAGFFAKVHVGEDFLLSEGAPRHMYIPMLFGAAVGSGEDDEGVDDLLQPACGWGPSG